MQSVHFRVTVGQKCWVQVQLPDDFKNQEIELVVVIQPVTQKIVEVEKSVDWVKTHQLVKFLSSTEVRVFNMNLFTNCIKHLLLFTALILTLSGCEDTGQDSNEPVTQYHRCPLSQQAGTNVPEIHEVDLFVTPPGAFNFYYNTFTAEDRITVSYEGKVLLDTGCVGEEKSKLITLPTNPKGEGVSSKIVVRVEPDCVGGKKDTEWSFTVDCPKCDFGSSDSEPERCFGGIGGRCKNDTPLAPKTYDYDNCTVEGFMSVGSILHDNCCAHWPNGWNCKNFIFTIGPAPKTEHCGEEWQEAWDNTTMCNTCPVVIGLSCIFPRQWKVKFGPFLNKNRGDFSPELKVPKGQRIDPKYQYLCNGGQCTSVSFDRCGLYCLCE